MTETQVRVLSVERWRHTSFSLPSEVKENEGGKESSRKTMIDRTVKLRLLVVHGFGFFLKSVVICLGLRWRKRYQHRKQSPLDTNHLQILCIEDPNSKTLGSVLCRKNFQRTSFLWGMTNIPGYAGGLQGQLEANKSKNTLSILEELDIKVKGPNHLSLLLCCQTESTPRAWHIKVFANWGHIVICSQ